MAAIPSGVLFVLIMENDLQGVYVIMDNFRRMLVWEVEGVNLMGKTGNAYNYFDRCMMCFSRVLSNFPDIWRDAVYQCMHRE